MYGISARKSVPWKLYSYSTRYAVLRYGKVPLRVVHYILKTFTCTVGRFILVLEGSQEKKSQNELVSFFISLRRQKKTQKRIYLKLFIFRICTVICQYESVLIKIYYEILTDTLQCMLIVTRLILFEVKSLQTKVVEGN